METVVTEAAGVARAVAYGAGGALGALAVVGAVTYYAGRTARRGLARRVARLAERINGEAKQ